MEERTLHEGLEELMMGEINDNNSKTNTTTTNFEFPIWNLKGEAPMRNIPLSSLPCMQGMTMEDPDTFLFEFDVLYISYDFITDAQNLKLFPATLKGAVLRWFMRLGPASISTWNDMKETFLSKYQDCCTTRDLREEISRMMQKCF